MATLSNQSLFTMGTEVPLVLAKLNSTISVSLEIFELPSTNLGQHFLMYVVHDHAQTLFDSGARNFLIVNMPPLGCSTAFKELYTQASSPSTNINLDLDDNECIRVLNDVVQMHNNVLREMLQYFRATHPNATFIYADYNGVIRHMLRTAKTEGKFDD